MRILEATPNAAVVNDILPGATQSSAVSSLPHQVPVGSPPSDGRADASAPAVTELVLVDDHAETNPTVSASSRMAQRGTSDDFYGAFSIETFADANPLYATHEDAQGFYNYVAQFNQPNFWYQDANVQPWAFTEEFDNWDDTYGFDAVNAVYYSGHGTMDDSGVFYAPLGGAWGDLGTWTNSNQMRLGNEQANYIFWSTCLSLRVLEGHSPMRTWQTANQGFRMIFGFETTSIDSPDYGKFFWEEWNKNKSFSTAWLDASWRISTHQSPSVAACGATQEEATSRLMNERIFFWDHVSTAWWWWRWYDAARSVRSGLPFRNPNLTLPSELLTARLAQPSLTSARIRSIVDGLGVPVRVRGNIDLSPRGGALLRDGEASLAVARDGSYRAQFAEANRGNREPIAVQRAMQTADGLVRQMKLDDDVELVFDQVRVAREAGGSDRGSGRLEGPFTTETTVHYRQAINGTPVVSSGRGDFSVSVDNDGKVTSVESTVRPVERIARLSAVSTPPAPNAKVWSLGGTRKPADYKDRLSQRWGRQLAAWATRGPVPGSFSVIPGTTEVGYAMEGNQARLVAQQTVEVDCGQGLRKRYQIVAKLDE